MQCFLCSSSTKGCEHFTKEYVIPNKVHLVMSKTFICIYTMISPVRGYRFCGVARISLWVWSYCFIQEKHCFRHKGSYTAALTLLVSIHEHSGETHQSLEMAKAQNCSAGESFHAHLTKIHSSIFQAAWYCSRRGIHFADILFVTEMMLRSTPTWAVFHV